MYAAPFFAIALTATVQATQIPTVHIPLDFYYGPNHKVSTNVHIPSTNVTIEVVYDLGSENFFLFGPNSTDNWGTQAIGSQGPCNVSVPPSNSFDYTRSPTASAPVGFQATYVYGGADKIYVGGFTVNDTFSFGNVAGESETVEDVRVETVDFLVQRINDPNCTYPPLYDLGIMGVSPFYNNASERVTKGPSIRQDLLQRGVIGAAVQSMWFEEAPADVYGTYTGGGLWGGIDTSKYSGELVKIAMRPQEGQPGYFVAPPTISVGNLTFSGGESADYCQLDSGTHDDTLPVRFEDQGAFYNATGIVTSPSGYVAWPGTCESIPANITIDLAFPAADGNANGAALVKVPLRNYARVTYSDADKEAGYCTLSLSTADCMLGAPFFTAAFFAADDEAGEVALAQGGVSKAGGGVDASAVVERIP